MIAAQDQVDIGGDLLLRRSKPNQLIRLVANLCYPQHESGQLSLTTSFLLTPMAALPTLI